MNKDSWVALVAFIMGKLWRYIMESVMGPPEKDTCSVFSILFRGRALYARLEDKHSRGLK